LCGRIEDEIDGVSGKHIIKEVQEEMIHFLIVKHYVGNVIVEPSSFCKINTILESKKQSWFISCSGKNTTKDI